MGEPLNIYGERLSVEVDFGELTINATHYDIESN